MLKTQTPQVSNKAKVNQATTHKGSPIDVAKPPKREVEEEAIEVFDEAGGIKKGSFLGNLLIRAAILAFINLVGVAGIIYFDRSIAKKAIEVKNLRSEQIGLSNQNSEVIRNSIEQYQKKGEVLAQVFPNDAGLVDFANELDRIRKEGKIVGFTFVAEEAVKDKTGSLGIPVLIEIKGTWAEIDTDLRKIQALPFLLRAIQVEAGPALEEGQIDFTFGGFLYVGKDFRKN